MMESRRCPSIPLESNAEYVRSSSGPQWTSASIICRTAMPSEVPHIPAILYTFHFSFYLFQLRFNKPCSLRKSRATSSGNRPFSSTS
jgi:hypothetical protein